MPEWVSLTMVLVEGETFQELKRPPQLPPSHLRQVRSPKNDPFLLELFAM